jgi:hypothetical protein
MMNRRFAFHAPTPATVSWWLTAQPGCMTQTAREQQDRMSMGKAASFVSGLPRMYRHSLKKATDPSSVSDGRVVLAMAGYEASPERIEESRPPSAVAVRL